MNKKPATKKEREYMGRVAELPCVACGAEGVQVHHIREDQGTGGRSGHYLTIPLCPDCHLGPLSIHATRRQFKNIYGSELSLLSKTIGALQ